jgi:hypothetical protein
MNSRIEGQGLIDQKRLLFVSRSALQVGRMAGAGSSTALLKRGEHPPSGRGAPTDCEVAVVWSSSFFL